MSQELKQFGDTLMNLKVGTYTRMVTLVLLCVALLSVSVSAFSFTEFDTTSHDLITYLSFDDATNISVAGGGVPSYGASLYNYYNSSASNFIEAPLALTMNGSAGAYYFNGSAEIADIAIEDGTDLHTYGLTDEATITLWFYNVGGNGTNNEVLFSFQNETGTGSRVIVTLGSGIVSTQVADAGGSSGTLLDFGFGTPTEAWVHYTWVFRDVGAETEVQIWRNATLVNNQTTSSSVNGFIFPNSCGTCRLGSTVTDEDYPPVENYLDEAIVDEYRIYNRSLSPIEIESVFNASFVSASSTPPTFTEKDLNTTLVGGITYNYTLNWTATNDAQTTVNDSRFTVVTDNTTQTVNVTFTPENTEQEVFALFTLTNGDGSDTIASQYTIEASPTWDEAPSSVTVNEDGTYAFVLNWTATHDAQATVNVSDFTLITDNVTQTVNVTYTPTDPNVSIATFTISNGNGSDQTSATYGVNLVIFWNTSQTASFYELDHQFYDPFTAGDSLTQVFSIADNARSGSGFAYLDVGSGTENVTGRFRTAMRANAVDEGLQRSDSASFMRACDGNTGCALQAWIKMDGATPATIFEHFFTSSRFFTIDNSNVQFNGVADSNGRWRCPWTPKTDNTWNHYTFFFDAPNADLVIYENGVVQTTYTSPNSGCTYLGGPGFADDFLVFYPYRDTYTGSLTVSVGKMTSGTNSLYMDQVMFIRDIPAGIAFDASDSNPLEPAFFHALQDTEYALGQNYTFTLNWTASKFLGTTLSNDSRFTVVTYNATQNISVTFNADALGQYLPEFNISNEDGSDTTSALFTVIQPPIWDAQPTNPEVNVGTNYTAVYNWTADNNATVTVNDTRATVITDNVTQTANVTVTSNASVDFEVTYTITNDDGSDSLTVLYNFSQPPVFDEDLVIIEFALGANYTYVLNYTSDYYLDSVAVNNSQFSIAYVNGTGSLNLTLNADTDGSFPIRVTISNALGSDTEDIHFTSVNSAPSAPGAFSAPTCGASFDQESYSVAWATATDVDADTLTYELHYSLNGVSGSYVALKNVSGLSTTLSTSDFGANSEQASLRVRTFDGLVYSGYTQLGCTYKIVSGILGSGSSTSNPGGVPPLQSVTQNLTLEGLNILEDTRLELPALETATSRNLIIASGGILSPPTTSASFFALVPKKAQRTYEKGDVITFDLWTFQKDFAKDPQNLEVELRKKEGNLFQAFIPVVREATGVYTVQIPSEDLDTADYVLIVRLTNSPTVEAQYDITISEFAIINNVIRNPDGKLNIGVILLLLGIVFIAGLLLVSYVSSLRSR